jgi:hypothetical protein
MSAYSPEIAASAIMPKDLISQASSLHFAMHMGKQCVEVALSEAAGGDFHWAKRFEFTENSFSGLNFIRERNWNERVFRKCTISFDSTKFCLVPSAFFDVDQSKNLLEFHSGAVEGEIAHLELKELDAVMIFERPDWTNDLSRIYPNARFFPLAYLLLKHARMVASRDQNCMMISVDKSMMVMIALRAGKLELCNGFSIQNDEDALYHASNSAMRLNFDFENVLIQLYSASLENSFHNLLKHYNKNFVEQFKDNTQNDASFISNLHVLCA